MNDLARLLGKRIYLFRKQNGLTQAGLAEKAKISNEFMSSIERGARLPSLPTLERVARVLGVKLKDLFNFDSAGFRVIQPLSRNALDLMSIIEGLSVQQRRRISKIVKILAESSEE